MVGKGKVIAALFGLAGLAGGGCAYGQDAGGPNLRDRTGPQAEAGTPTFRAAPRVRLMQTTS